MGLLTSTVLSVDSFRATANLDYYTKSGVGYGGALAYHDPQKFRGALQVYTINDKTRDTQRWGADGGYWWEAYDSSDSLNNKSGAIYFSQLELRRVSDPDFNDDFFRANPYVVSPDQITRTSIVRQSAISNLRVSYSKRSKLSEDRRSFINDEEISPKADLTFNPFAFGKTGIVNNLNFSFNSTAIGDNDPVRYLRGGWSSSKNFKLHPNFNLIPKVFYDQQTILKDSGNSGDDSFIGRYGADIALRSNLVTGMLDTGYRYSKRMQSSSLPDSPQNPDENAQENMFYVQNYYMPSTNLYFKLASGIDVGNKADNYIKSRLIPLIMEINGLMPSIGTNVFVRNSYDLTEGGNQSFILNASFHAKENGFASFGVANYNTNQELGTNSDVFLFTTQFSIAPKKFSWRADMGIDFNVGDSHFAAYSKHILVHKDFHDFGIMLGIRDRNQNLSFSFRINVYCGKAEKKPADKEIDRYWYPWRAENMTRDNF
jgi:hypothetical protein